MTDERDLIRSRIDIVELVGQRVHLKKSGKDWKGLCPFHDDRNPSFHVSPGKGIYKCYSCGAGGDVFTWVMETERVDFPEALRLLAQQAGVELKKRDRREPSVIEAQELAMAEALSFFREQISKSSAAREYCQGRGLDADVLDAWEIGYAPDVNAALATHLQKKGLNLALCRDLFLVDKDTSGGYFDRFRGRLMFPIRDERGKLVAFGGRILGDGQPKYINSSDTPVYNKGRVLYGMDRAKASMSEAGRATLVEGYLDVIACHRAGVTTAVASLGTSLSEDHVRLLKRWCQEVVVLYDSDTAGQKAASRACELLSAAGLKARVALVPEGKDPDTLLRAQGPEAVRRTVENPVTEAEYALNQLEARYSVESDEFWDAAYQVLAKVKRHQDAVRLIDVLAPRFPATRDQKVARVAIEQSVRAIRRQARSGSGANQAPARRSAVSFLRAAEAAVIKALLVPELRQRAIGVCQRPDLFESKAGADLAKVVAEEFAAGAPTGPPATWLPAIASEDLKSALMDLEVELLPNRERWVITEESFEGAVARLEASAEGRAQGELKGQALVDIDARKALMERIKASHKV